MAADIQKALVAFVRGRPALSALLGNPPQTRFYPEAIPDNVTQRPAATYTLAEDDRPQSLGGSAGYGVARIRVECWGDGSQEGHLHANQLMLAIMATDNDGGLNGYRGAMGSGDDRVFVQRASCENAQKASPPPAAGEARGDAMASVDVVLWFDDV